MPFMRRLIILAVVALATTLIYLFGFKKAAENQVETELSKFKSQVESMNDGSALTYSAPRLDSDYMSISDITYTDGKSGTDFKIGTLKARPNQNGGLDGQLINITIQPQNAQTIFISNASFTKLETFQNLNNMTFEQVTLAGISAEGQITSRKKAKLNLANIIANNAKAGIIESIEFNGLSLGDDSKPSAFAIDNFSLQQMNISSLKQDLSALQNGELPLTLLPITGVSESSQLSELLNEGQPSANTDIENQVLDLFLKNAPQELKDLFDNPTAPEFREGLNKFNEKTPEDQLIDGLELPLKGLKSNQETN